VKEDRLGKGGPSIAGSIREDVGVVQYLIDSEMSLKQGYRVYSSELVDQDNVLAVVMGFGTG
jgi:hypothetical protein